MTYVYILLEHAVDSTRGSHPGQDAKIHGVYLTKSGAVQAKIRVFRQGKSGGYLAIIRKRLKGYCLLLTDSGLSDGR